MKPSSTRERLTRELHGTDITTLGDFLYVLLANIEDGLLTAGFIPDVDYTCRDLLTAATPLLANSFATHNLSIATSYP
ncbi:MAG: hypothetical protein K2P77_10335 [Burkholderiaceae bacterium]|nr:hypothetical protein [Burkholderiaceae bacterium]